MLNRLNLAESALERREGGTRLSVKIPEAILTV